MQHMPASANGAADVYCPSGLGMPEVAQAGLAGSKMQATLRQCYLASS